MTVDPRVIERAGRVLREANTTSPNRVFPGDGRGAVLREGVVTSVPTTVAGGLGSVVQVAIGGSPTSVPVRFVGPPPPLNAYVVVAVMGQMTYIVGQVLANANGSGTIVQERSFSQSPAGTSTFTNTSFANVYSSMGFTKMFSGTVLRFAIFTSAWATVSPGLINFGITVNGGTNWTTTAWLYFSSLSIHLTIARTTDITGVAAGPLTIQPGIAVASGMTGNIDTNDSLAYTVREVWP